MNSNTIWMMKVSLYVKSYKKKSGHTNHNRHRLSSTQVGCMLLGLSIKLLADDKELQGGDSRQLTRALTI